MSVDNNVNSSKIQRSKEHKDDDNAINSSAMSTSHERTVDSSVSIKEELEVDSSTTKVSSKSIEIIPTIAKSENINSHSSSVEAKDNSWIQSSQNSKSHSPTRQERTVDSAFSIKDELKIDSSTTAGSENSKSHPSSDESNVDSSIQLSHFSSNKTVTTSIDVGSYTESVSNRHEIEESILKMITHIENEIKSEEHIGLNENHFQNIEIQVKTSQVMVAIEQMIQKLEIAFCLPWILVENMNAINNLCGEAHMNKLVNEYCKIRDSEDMDICRFQPTTINCINDAFEAGLNRFVNLHRNKLSETESNFLATMVQFKCMAEWQMGMSAIQAMNKEKTLHKMWTSNEKIKLKINELETQYENYEKKLQELLDEKNSIIAAHNQTVLDLENRNTNDINTEIFKSNKAMRRVCVASEEKQKVLTAELQQITEAYDKLVQNNLVVEKKLRDQKSKTRQKLQAVLTKYDTGVGERFAELLRIRTELEEETVLYENKVKEFQLQEIEYNQIMADKAEVDAKIREEKLILFMMNRSARIIQRAYKKMMKKRKKGKKGKKGKKAKKLKK